MKDKNNLIPIWTWFKRGFINLELEKGIHMMMSSNGNIFCVTGLLWGEFTGHQWIPHTKASDVELWCFLWSAPEPTFEQTMETVINYRMSLQWNKWLTYPLLVIGYHVAVLKIRTIKLSCLRPVKSGSVLFIRLARPEKFTRYCVTQWISKLLGSSP